MDLATFLGLALKAKALTSSSTLKTIGSEGHNGTAGLKRRADSSDDATDRPRKRCKRAAAIVYDKIFPFEKLPAELREMVYKELFVRKTVRLKYCTPAANIHIVKAWTTPNCSSEKEKKLKAKDRIFLGKTGAAILCASRQIYNEALPVLYGWNTFEFQSTRAIRPWLTQTGSGIELLQSVSIMSCSRVGLILDMRALRKATSLKELKFGLLPYDRYEVNAVAQVVDPDATKAEREARLATMSFTALGFWDDGAQSSPRWSSSEAPGTFKDRLKVKLELN